MKVPLMQRQPEKDEQLMQLFESLKRTPQRSSENARAGKMRFLQQAQSIASMETRHTGPIRTHAPMPLSGKRPVLKPILITFLILLVLFGGGGLTVSYAQASLPNDMLYSVKTLSEDIELGLTVRPENEFTLMLEFTDRRLDEIRQLVEAGEAIPENVQERYQNQVENAIQIALSAPVNQVVADLTKLRDRVNQQNASLSGFVSQTSATNQAAFEKIRLMLMERSSWLETGIGDPSLLAEQMRLREMKKRGIIWSFTHSPTASGKGPGSTMTPTHEPGNGFGPGPLPTGTQTPGSGYGPGPYPTSTGTPGGYGPRPTQSPGQTQQPGPTNQPGPTTQPGPTGQPGPTDQPGATQEPGPKH